MALAAPPASALATPTPALGGWKYQDRSGSDYVAIEAVLTSRDRRGRLVVRCDVTWDHTLSIQYKPSEDIGISMAPVVLDWFPSRGPVLSSKLVWEPDRTGAFARDGIDDRHASDVAVTLQQTAGTLVIVAADRGGEPTQSVFESEEGRAAVGRVLEQCPWRPARTPG